MTLRIHPDHSQYKAYLADQQATQRQCIEEDERTLRRNGVPERFWLYLVCNSRPQNCPNPADRLGTWWTRERSLADIERQPGSVYADPLNNALYYAVVDGRDRQRIMDHIAASWLAYGGDEWWGDKMTRDSSFQ
jgi:hypothetical protein